MTTEQRETSTLEKVLTAAFRVVSLKILIKSLLVSFVIFLLLYSVLLVVLLVTGATLLSFVGILGAGALWIVATIGGVYLFPMVFVAVLLFFLEDLVKVNSAVDFPDMKIGKGLGIKNDILTSIRFLLLLIGLNILVLPLFLLAIFAFPLFGFIMIYLPLNGYLIAYEYHALIASIFLKKKAVKANWKYARGSLIFFGCLTYILLLIPVINLFAPYISILAIFYYWEKHHMVKKIVPKLDSDKQNVE